MNQFHGIFFFEILSNLGEIDNIIFKYFTSVNAQDSLEFSGLAAVCLHGLFPSRNQLFVYYTLSFFTAVQEKYRKSSVTKQIKNKFSSSLINKKKSDQIGNNHPGVDVVGSNNSMSKFRSHSHGALPSLDEFTKSTGLLSFFCSVKKSTVCLQPRGKRNWSIHM